ncbi:MAG TPA: alpha-2-macroglobulin family protein [Chthonomonadales bacterium]|nr:alpha-2-macroglobulin family protein [Chthonomonadales bacterium]
MEDGRSKAAVVTDDLGIAVYSLDASANSRTLHIVAADGGGHSGENTVTLPASGGPAGILLQASEALATVGDQIHLHALCSLRSPTIYLDAVVNGRTVLTAARQARSGRANFLLALTPEMAGTLHLHAYVLLPNVDIVRAGAAVVVSPAGGLRISAAPDKSVYRPGEDATVRLTVRDAQMKPVAAALGIAMVDESVLALTELKPGLERVYFTLEKELLTPKVEIHGLEPTFLLLNPKPIRSGFGGSVRGWAQSRETAAAMLLASLPDKPEFDFKFDTFDERWSKVKGEFAQEMVRAARKIQNAIGRYGRVLGSDVPGPEALQTLVRQGYLKDQDIRDRWGTPFRIDLYGAADMRGYFTLSSAGPDRRWGDADDINGVSPFGSPRLIEDGRMLGMLDGARQDRMFGGGGFAGVPGPLGPPMEEAQALAAANGRLSLLNAAAKSSSSRGGSAAQGTTRVRSYFPETMFWNPDLITDDEGVATLRLPMADSITTWRLSALADSLSGEMGSADFPVKVFQPFFVDLDLPSDLTQNDRIQMPVSIYNYLPTPQKVTVTLQTAPWFSLDGPSKQTVLASPGQVQVVHFPILVHSFGRFPLQVSAIGSGASDAVRRTVHVLPDGEEIRAAVNDRLAGTVTRTLKVPVEAIAGATKLWVKLYPGAFSQVVEGLDGVLRMPNGCFEQTSSTTYPDVLILNYLKENKRINPEIQMRAEQYINIGYQRLVTFECKGGGFSWFGDEPAHQILTAYGLLEFNDMARVHEVDKNLIQRTQQWLATMQRKDGSWQETNQGIVEGIINRQTTALRSTAYVTWALAESGYNGPEVKRGMQYVGAHLGEARDAYSLAVILNMMAAVMPGDASTAQVAGELIKLARVSNDAAYWQSDGPTFTGAIHDGADMETSGLATYGLARWGGDGAFTTKALTYLVRCRDSFGSWGATQATVWAMKALLYASANSVGGGKGDVQVSVNGKPAASIHITSGDTDVMQQVDVSQQVRKGINAITISYTGSGAPLYQIACRYYLPWTNVEQPLPKPAPISVSVRYDRQKLFENDTATVDVAMHNNADFVVEMPLIDVGVPPGFTVLPDALNAAVAKKTISKFTIAGRQVILYLQQLQPGETVHVLYDIKARFPVKALTPVTRAYPYYNPREVAYSVPQMIEVKPR